MASGRLYDGEALALRGAREALIEGHEGEAARIVVRRGDGGGELERVRSPKWVDANEPDGRPSDSFGGLDLLP